MVGGIVTLIDLGCFYLFIHSGMPIIPAHLISYCTAYPVHYVLNRHYTFRQTGPLIVKHAAYGWSLGLLTLGLSTVILWGLSYIVPPLIAKIGTTALILVLNFLINKHFIFKSIPPP